MKTNSILVIGATLLATVAGATSAHAGCKSGFCVKGYWDGQSRLVDFSTSMSGYTHFNVNDGTRQFEVGRNVRTFQVVPTSFNPVKFRYSIQACAKGSVFSKSNCSPWVTFTHTEK
ncbi:MAG: hypothetical protein AB7E80_00400 [Hyphomicrobiaceae bacterium]